jgi:tetratricopeptide (TPR) repeat protein
LRNVVPLVMLLLTAAVYLPALWFGFVCDDSGQIVESQSRYSWSAVPSYFGSDVWNFIVTGKTDYYRPVFLLWMMLNSKLFGLNTALLHAAALGLHLGVTLLLYFLALRLTRSPVVSGAAALLFGIHPVHIEVVAWLSGVTESLFAVLALGAILCQLRGRRAGALLLFTFAIFAKETAVALPLLLAACDWLFPANSGATRRQRLMTALSTLAWCLGIGLFYVAARIHALGAFAPVTRGWTTRIMVWTEPSLLVFYLRQLLTPFQYSLFYSMYPVVHFSSRRVAEPLLLLAVAMVFLLLIARQSKSLAFAALLLVVPIVPTLNLNAFMFDNFAHDRYLYLPSAGLCLLAAAAAAHWIYSEESGARMWLKAALAIAFAAAAAGLAYVNLENSGVWADNLSLFSHAVEVAPESIIAHEYLANELMTQQRFADALPEFQNALLSGAVVDETTNQLLYEPIGLCYLGLGQLDEAEGYLYRAISLDPKVHFAHLYLSLIEERRGRLPEAEKQAREALRLRPGATPKLSTFHSELAQILEEEGNLQGARAEYEAELQEDPASVDGRQRLQDLDERISRRSPTP